MSEHAPFERRPLDRGSLAVIAIVFAVVFLLLLGLSLALEFRGYMDWLMEGNAAILKTIVSWLGIPATRVGRDVYLQNHTLSVAYDCTAITIMALYTAVIVAYPLSAKTRGLALAVGIPVIAVANIVRLVGGALASQYLSSSMFDFLHDYLFKVAMILVVVVLWAVWLQMARTHASKS